MMQGKGKMATYLLSGRKDCLGNMEISVPDREGDTFIAEIPCCSGTMQASESTTSLNKVRWSVGRLL